MGNWSDSPDIQRPAVAVAGQPSNLCPDSHTIADRSNTDSRHWNLGTKTSPVSVQLFCSGPWTGFYNYHPGGERHRMQLQLTFTNGLMSGDGVDDVGRFLIRGRYDTATLECHWTKSYIGAHDVFYRGFREGKGIWGRWEIKSRLHGGFHIWSRRAGEGEEQSEEEELAEPVDAIATDMPAV